MPISQILRAALPDLMKSGDKEVVGAIRSALSAIENAESVDMAGEQVKTIEQSPIGGGAHDIARRSLDDEEARDIVRAEITERDEAAALYDRAGQPERASELRRGTAALQSFLDQP